MDSGERKLVTTMPLHAITSTYGEEGLRARFAADIETWPGPDTERLNRALDLAGRLHAADRREREPYVNHLLRVAIRIISHYGVRDADVACAALLHDAVEDHAAELSGGGGQETALAGAAAGSPRGGGGGRGAGRGWPKWSARSPPRRTRRAATRMSSTGNTSPRA